MTDAQLYLAIGLPVFAVAMNMVAGILQMNSISARITTLESSLGARLGSLNARCETLIGKVIDIDNRLTRVEAILERH